MNPTKAYVGEFNARHGANPVPKKDGYKARMDEAKAYHTDKIISMLDECSPEDLSRIADAVQERMNGEDSMEDTMEDTMEDSIEDTAGNQE